MSSIDFDFTGTKPRIPPVWVVLEVLLGRVGMDTYASLSLKTGAWCLILSRSETLRSDHRKVIAKACWHMGLGTRLHGLVVRFSAFTL